MKKQEQNLCYIIDRQQRIIRDNQVIIKALEVAVFALGLISIICIGGYLI